MSHIIGLYGSDVTIDLELIWLQNDKKQKRIQLKTKVIYH